PLRGHFSPGSGAQRPQPRPGVVLDHRSRMAGYPLGSRTLARPLELRRIRRSTMPIGGPDRAGARLAEGPPLAGSAAAPRSPCRTARLRGSRNIALPPPALAVAQHPEPLVLRLS